MEVLLQLPFYIMGLVAWQRRSNWIRVPAIVYSTQSLTVMFLIIAVSFFSEDFATPRPLEWSAAYALWVIMPVLVLWRAARDGGPFPETGKLKDA